MDQRSPFARLLLWQCVFVTVMVMGHSSPFSRKKKDQNQEEDNKGCSTLLVPVSQDVGWGVVAGRDFVEGELVEVVPAYILLATTGVEIQSSILNDYAHSSGCGSDDNGEMDQLLIGHGSSYNHHANPNIMFVDYGSDSGKKHVMAVQALRNITQGEELLARYGDNDWFESRNLVQSNNRPATPVIPAVDMSWAQSKYCSKIQAGFGYTTWTDEVVPRIASVDFTFDAGIRLATIDSGFGVVRATTALQEDDRIEMSLGLIVSQRIMADSAFAPLVVGWQDLDPIQQRTVRMLRTNYRTQFVVHYPGMAERHDEFESYEDLGILPIGALVMVRRLGGKNSVTATNCRLKIKESMQRGSNSLSLELIATQPIQKGEVLVLDLPPAGTAAEWKMLEATLKRTGQPYHPSTFTKPAERDEL